jgi:putative transposase
MAVREKIILSNEIYFITFTILGWNKIFINDKYINLVYKWFDYIKENYKNKIYGYVIMPNHVHSLIYITDKSPELPALIQNAKRFLAYQVVDLLEEDKNMKLLNFFRENANFKKRAKHKVFQDRYDSKLIQTSKLFLEKLNYIHSNPCSENWKLADNPENYKYSSASNYILGKGVYNVDILNVN